MRKPSFTPGPWVYVARIETMTVLKSGPGGYGDYAAEEPFEMRSVESVDGKTVISDEYGISEGDLRLIAAAPELLEALRGLLSVQGPFKVAPGESRLEAAERKGNQVQAALDSARAAIAKAEGRGE